MTRSEIMSRIKSTGNKSTELTLAKIFRRNHCTGWRRQQKIKGISVDFAFRKLKLAVFVDGCFWHACEQHCNVERLKKYWQDKVIGNAQRDSDQNMILANAGWTVKRIWEHDLKGIKV